MRPKISNTCAPLKVAVNGLGNLEALAGRPGLLLVGEQAKLCDDQASARLPEVLTLPARGAAAAAIESSLEVLLRNALAQITQALEMRCPKSGNGGENAGSKPFDYSLPVQDDFPTVLPSPPKKTEPAQASPGS